MIKYFVTESCFLLVQISGEIVALYVGITRRLSVQAGVRGTWELRGTRFIAHELIVNFSVLCFNLLCGSSFAIVIDTPKLYKINSVPKETGFFFHPSFKESSYMFCFSLFMSKEWNLLKVR